MTEPAHHPRFTRLIDYLKRVPAISANETPSSGFGSGLTDGVWWLKFSIDVDHRLAWNAVQEMAHVLNYMSVSQRLPTSFKPVSPPPYLNGGPRDYLSWVIECPEAGLSPGKVAEWLEGRLPQPVEDESAWPGIE